ncbi:MAG: VWA domain-containing protein [Luteimonas sp.]|nr:VWA domain-containing protein [Luteimonas sp.]
MTGLFADFHLLRPAWLWALLALPLIVLAWHWRRRREDAWREAVDAHLLAHLAERGIARHGAAVLALQCMAWMLAVLALAGPSWRTIEHPLMHGGAPMVIAVDMSEATLAGDLPPSRLLQARTKLAELLRERNGRPTGLIAYAGDAFTVTPLTDDTANIALFLDALSPEIMPEAGNRASRAIEIGSLLLDRAGHAQGDILLLTDHADGDAVAAATRARTSGHRTSVLGMGTVAGATYRRGDGGFAHARLDAASLTALVAAGGGVLSDWNEDVRAVATSSPGRDAAASEASEAGMRAWRDDGYWLLLPLMLLALFAFRRGAAVAVLAACLLLPLPQAHAADGDGGLWQRADQARHARMRQGIDAYRAGEFDDALRAWDGLPGAEAAYNRGNALARQGNYEDAIAAYDDALRQQPGMGDAEANRQAVAAAMQRRPPSGGGERDPRADGEGDDAPEDGQGDAGEPEGGATSPETSQAQGNADPGKDEADGTSPRERQQSPSGPGPAADTEAQRAADDAQRERMQRALQQDGERADDGALAEGDPGRAETEAERERRQANEAWLRRIPDDPGGLLRAKFKLEHERRSGRGGAP